MRLVPFLFAMLGLTLAQSACDDPSGTSTPGDTSEIFVPADTTDTTQVEATDTARPETTDTAQPEATDTTRPETTDTAQPETTDTAQPETTDTTQPETTDTAEPETTDTTQPETIEDISEPDSDVTGPAGWTCSASWYGDEDCDCGCGIVDVDCPSGATVADCEFCTNCGSGTACDGALVDGDITQCIEPECGDNIATPTEDCDGTDLRDQTCDDVDGFAGGVLRCSNECMLDTSGCNAIAIPDGWTCTESFYGDGDCDCGCGVIDLDCPAGATADDCAYCYCGGFGCEGMIEPADITQCIEAECGDGVVEGREDCDGGNVDGATCITEGYIGGTLACSDTCSFDLSACERATAPDGWVCDTNWYGDGDCDCGCGAMDIDCPAAATVIDCQYCLNCDATTDDCSTALDPTDVTQCIEP